MSIKVRCGECESVLNLPDAAAGKVAKCKSCGARVRVPGKKRRPGTAASKQRSRPSRSESASPEDALLDLDLRGIEDKNRRVCPSCAHPVHVDDIECPKCGVTIATGTLSARQRIRKERKGPPPEEFYGKAPGNAWAFLKKHWGYGVSTATVWTLTLSLSVTCLYAWVWYIEGRTEELTEEASQAEIRIVGNSLIIEPRENGKVTYDNKTYRQRATLLAPRLAAIRSPPSYFWAGMAVVFQLGFGGWAWTLATKIVELTMAGEKKIKRFHIDFFGNLTMGFRFYFWPIVVMAPVVWIGPALVAAGHELAGGITMAIILTIAVMLFLPAAVVHMSQKYQYRAWLLTWMLRDATATLVPTLYVAALLFVLVLLLPLGAAAAIGATWSQTGPWLSTQFASALTWLADNVNNFGEGNMRFLFYEFPVVFGSAFCVFFVLCSLVSFPAVFMMRVIGLYGVYFRPDLALVNEFPDLEPAGFGPRYLAYLVDSIILLLLNLVAVLAVALLRPLYGLYSVPEQYSTPVSQGLITIITLVFWAMYFSRGESGSARATLGKWSIGLIVLRDDNNPVSRKQALQRAVYAFFGVIPLYAGFLMCIFRPDKKAMHDIASKTKVVWRGEDL